MQNTLPAEMPVEQSRLRPLTRTRRPGEFVAEGIIKLVAFGSSAMVLIILIFVAKEAFPLLLAHGDAAHGEASLGALFRSTVVDGETRYLWQPISEVAKYNIIPLCVGSLKVTLVALVISVPLSVGAAVYVAEYAGKRSKEWIKPAIELLAGVPSVVVGFFALVVLAGWIQKAFGTEHRLNSLVAGAGLAFAICPIVFSIAEDALTAVPASYRTAATALGSTRAQTILRVVLPAASPGIVAAVLLGMGRAVGETMIVLLASGNASLLDADLGHSTRTITATIAQELGEVVIGGGHYQILFALGAILFFVTCIINVLGEQVVFRMRRKLGGSS